MHLTVYGEKQPKNKHKPKPSLHWGTETVRLPVLIQCGFMSSSGRFNRFYTPHFMMPGRAWLHVAFLKAPAEDTEEIQNKTMSPTNANVISTDAAVEVLLSDSAESTGIKGLPPSSTSSTWWTALSIKLPTFASAFQILPMALFWLLYLCAHVCAC